MSSGHSFSTDRSGTETGTMPSLGGTALAVGCLSESMEGALRERSNIFQACAGKCCSSKRSLHYEHGTFGRVATLSLHTHIRRLQQPFLIRLQSHSLMS